MPEAISALPNNWKQNVKDFLQKKTIRTALKAFLGMLCLLILFLVALSIYLQTHRTEIVQKVKDQLHASINGDVELADIDFSVIRHFPNIGIHLEHIRILDTQYHQPLLQAGEISTGIGWFQLLKKDKTISEVEVSNGLFHLFTLSNGYSNNYILSPQKKKPANTTAGTVHINKVKLTNVHAIIEDALRDKKYECVVTDLYVKLDYGKEDIKLKMDEDIFIKGLGFQLSKGSYLANCRLQANSWEIHFNTVNKEMTFSQSKIKINNQPYSLTGKFHFADSAFFHLDAVAKNVPFMEAAKIITERIRQKMRFANLQRNVNVHATLSGPLKKPGDPFINVDLTTGKNMMVTPVTTFTDCGFSGNFNNHKSDTLGPGDENSAIVLRKFTANWNGLKISTDSIFIHNLKAPLLRFKFLSTCSLPELDSNLAMSSLHLTKGSASLEISYDGQLVPDPSLLAKVTAAILLKDGEGMYIPRNILFSNCNGFILITENALSIQKLMFDIQQNHFEINASGTHVNRVALTDSGKAFFSCNVYSPSINGNDFNLLFEQKKTITHRTKAKKGLNAVAEKIDNMLVNGNMQLNFRTDHLTYKNFTADNITASILFTTDNWQIDQAKLQHAGGNFYLNARFDALKNNMHEGHATVKLEHVDMRKVLYAFDNFGQDAITSANIRGILSTHANIRFLLSTKGTLIKRSLRGDIDFTLRKGALIHFKPFENINDIVFKNRDFSDVQFAELTDKLSIDKGEMTINRMEIASTVLHIYVEGLYDFNHKNTDISIQVPLNNLSKSKNDTRKEKKGLDAKTGASVYLRAQNANDGSLKIGLDVFKKWRKNKSGSSNKNLHNEKTISNLMLVLHGM